jgi:molecular chaperone GrpE
MTKKQKTNTEDEIILDQEVNESSDREAEFTKAQDDIESEFVELGEDGEEVSGKDMVKKLREKIKTLEKEKAEYMQGWQRAKADYSNREAQISKERVEFVKIANKKLITDILPTLDNYDAARANVDAWGKVDEGWRMGIEYIFSSLVSKLEQNGLIQYGNVGDTFNPAEYEAVEIIDAENSNIDNTVAQVMQKGYKIGESILRPARVKVYTVK